MQFLERTGVYLQERGGKCVGTIEFVYIDALPLSLALAIAHFIAYIIRKEGLYVQRHDSVSSD